MQVKKNRVDYTEVEVTMDADEVRQVLTEYMKTTKNVEARPADIVFNVKDFDSSTGEECTFLGVVVRVLKRGRAHANGRRGRPPKISVETKSDDEFPEAEVDEKEAKKPRKAKKTKPKEPEELDEE